MTSKKRLDRFINHIWTELSVGLLIIISIVLTVLEGSAGQDSRAYEIYSTAGFVITLVFVVELSIRWYVAKSTRHFWREYWLDVIAVLPLVRPLRMLRVLRLLRLVRLGILITRRSRRLAAVIHEGLAENMLIVVILVVVFLIGAIGMNLAERSNVAFQHFGDAVWWSLYTLMAGEPIGGEPQTFMGRVITMIVMMGGFTIFAMFTGVISAVMVDRLRNGMEAKEMELEDLNNHYIICGWNRAAKNIILELQNSAQTRHTPVVVITELDEEPELPRTGINTGLIFFVRGDYTSTEILRTVRVERAQKAILLADKAKPRSDQDRDARTILAALTIEKLNRNIHTCAELLNRDNSNVLEMAGVEDIVVGDEYMGNLIAHSTRAYGLVQVLDELLTAMYGNGFHKVEVPKKLRGKTIAEAMMTLKREHDALLVAIETRDDSATPPGEEPIVTHGRDGDHFYVTNPGIDYELKPEDHLILVARRVQLD